MEHKLNEAKKMKMVNEAILWFLIFQWNAFKSQFRRPCEMWMAFQKMEMAKNCCNCSNVKIESISFFFEISNAKFCEIRWKKVKNVKSFLV